MSPNKTSRRSDQFTLRFPDGMRERIKKIAESNRRTANAELIVLIEKGIAADVDNSQAPSGEAIK
jgi:predicted DNA-binding protein